jgi:hypothetical protein
MKNTETTPYAQVVNGPDRVGHIPTYKVVRFDGVIIEKYAIRSQAEAMASKLNAVMAVIR